MTTEPGFFDEPSMSISWGVAAAMGAVIALVAGGALAYLNVLLRSELLKMEVNLSRETTERETALERRIAEREDRFKVSMDQIVALHVAPITQRLDKLEEHRRG